MAWAEGFQNEGYSQRSHDSNLMIDFEQCKLHLQSSHSLKLLDIGVDAMTDEEAKIAARERGFGGCTCTAIFFSRWLTPSALTSRQYLKNWFLVSSRGNDYQAAFYPVLVHYIEQKESLKGIEGPDRNLL